MYCKNCGKEMADGQKFCADCGAPIDSERKTAGNEQAKIVVKTDNLPAYLCIGTAVVMIISGFLKLFHFKYDAAYRTVEEGFTPFEFMKTMNKMFDIISHIDKEQETAIQILAVISYGYYVLFALAAIIIIKCLRNLNATKGKTGISYFRQTKAANLLMLCANVGIYMLLIFVNLALKESLDLDFFEISIFGGNALFFITTIIGIVGFMAATSGIKSCWDEITGDEKIENTQKREKRRKIVRIILVAVVALTLLNVILTGITPFFIILFAISAIVMLMILKE